MPATCLLCLLRIPSMQATLGFLQDPVGACKICHSFACGHHGRRDPQIPAFECVACVPAAIAAAAYASKPREVDEDLPLLQEMGIFFIRHEDAIPKQWLDPDSVEVIDDWSRNEKVVAAARQRILTVSPSAPSDVRRALSRFQPYSHANLLLIIAHLLFYQYDLPKDQTPHFLVQIVENTDVV